MSNWYSSYWNVLKISEEWYKFFYKCLQNKHFKEQQVPSFQPKTSNFNEQEGYDDPIYCPPDFHSFLPLHKLVQGKNSYNILYIS